MQWIGGAALALAFTSPRADLLSPTSFEASIAAGGTVSVHKTLTVSQSRTSGPVDIFFLTDSTKSMEPAIASVRAGAADVLASTAGFGDVRWGVGEYRDVNYGAPDAWVYRTNQGLTSNVASVLAGIGGWVTSSGGDLPEANLFALQQVATIGDIGWREGSTRILAWFGDAPGHDTATQERLAAAIASLRAAHIKVEAIDVGIPGSRQSLNAMPGQASEIVKATGGALFSGVTPLTLVAGIEDAIGVAVNSYSSVCLDTSAVPAGISAEASPCITGTFDRSVERSFGFDLSFTGLVDGDYAFTTWATVDAGRVAGEADRIVVGSVTLTQPIPEPETYTMMFFGLGLLVVVTRRRRQKAVS